jgi:hypothetical protein
LPTQYSQLNYLNFESSSSKITFLPFILRGKRVNENRMENLILGHSLGPDAREITKLVGQEILRWGIHIAIFLVVVVAVFLWRHETDGEVQREQVCGILEGEILRGCEVDGFQGTEERKMWFLERLGVLQVQEIKNKGKDEGKGEDKLHKFNRACVEVAEMSERFERFKRVKEDVGKEWKDIWCECNPT